MIEEVSKEQYKEIVNNTFSGFDKIDFIELNKYKVDEVKYFIFEDGKKRFGFVAGIKDGVLKSPFSATFSCFSEISNNKILYYHKAIKSLIEWSKDHNIKKIIICTPPLFYDENHITKFQNALFCNGFKILDYDVNFQLNLINKRLYDSIINTDARRNIKIAEKNNLIFQKTYDISSVYKVIKQNREEKGYPLWMSEQNIIDTSKIIKSDYFLVSYENKNIASAYIQHIKENIVNVVYWGNLQEYDRLCPMNFLAKNVYEYYLYNKKKINYISIGTSTLDSIPNYGLCDFKESIGCDCSPKLNFILEII